jgi:hypothetical protein
MPKYEEIFDEASDLLNNAIEQNPAFGRPVKDIITPVLLKMGIKPTFNDLKDFVIPFIQAEFFKAETEIEGST